MLRRVGSRFGECAMKLNKFLASALFAAGLAVGAGQASAAVVFDFANANVPAGSYRSFFPGGQLFERQRREHVGRDFGGMSGVQTNGSAREFPGRPRWRVWFIQSYSGAPGHRDHHLQPFEHYQRRTASDFQRSGRPSYLLRRSHRDVRQRKLGYLHGGRGRLDDPDDFDFHRQWLQSGFHGNFPDRWR